MHFLKIAIKNLLLRLMGRLEARAHLHQVKEWGSTTVDYEVKVAARLLGGKPQLCIDEGGNAGGGGVATPRLFWQNSKPKLSCLSRTKNHRLLLGTFSDNERIKIEDLALSNRNGFATLYAAAEGSGLASLTKRRLDHHGIACDLSEQVKTV